MATNDNTQVNSFVKGMNSDVSYSMLLDGQYTFAKNIRITLMNKIGDGLLTNGQGDIRPIEGVEVHGTAITPKSILATGSIRDIGVIVYVDSKDNTWKVGVFKNGSPEDIFVIFQSEEEALVEKFSIVLHHEIENLDKLYVADGVNPIKLILIKLVNGNFVDVSKEEVESYPKMLLNPPHFRGLVEGQLKAGMVQYAYRLYKKYGIATDISPTTNLIPIVNHETLRGYNQGRTTNSGVELFVEMNKKYDFLDRIQIFRVHYEENGQLPIISIVYDDAVSKLIFPDSMLNRQTDPEGRVYYITFIDNGRVELGQISLEEFNSMLGQRIIPKVIESKNDYMFAAQIKDVQSDVFKGVSKKDFGTVSYELVYIDLIGDGSQLVGDGITHNTITSKLSLPNWNFNYTGSEGDNIYSVLHDYSVYSNPMYSNPKVSYNLKSLRDGETYRYGIILYNSDGESSGVIYLDDVTVKRDRPTFKIGSGYELIITPVGIKWTFEKFPEGTAAYEIVRCRRTEADMRSISQGVLSRPVKRYKWQNDSVDDNYPYTPTGFVTLLNFVFTQDYWDRPTSEHKILYHSDNLDNKTLFLFISPEACYNPDTINGITKDTDINLSVITALYLPLNKTNSVNITNYTISGYYHAAYNNALLQYESTNIGDRQIPVIGFATGGYYDIDGKFSHNENPYGSAFYRVDGGNRGDEWSYIPATDKSLDSVDPVYLDWDDVKSIKERSFAYIKLYATTAAGTPLTNNSNKYEIHSCKTVSSLLWNEIWNGKTSSNSANNTYEDHITIVGTNEYNNAVVGPWYGENIKVQDKGEGVTPVDTDFEPVFSTLANNKIDYQNSDFIFSASGGDCAIISTNSELNLIKYEDLPINYLKSRMESDLFLYTYLCNITKETIPYGGTSDSAIKNSVYYSYGDYNNSTNNTFVTFNGDTFIEPFEYVSMHKIYYSVAGDTVPSHMICYSIPVETSMNLIYSYGYGFSQNYAQNPNISNIQSQPASVLSIYNQSKPLYAYNNVYSTNSTSRLFAAAEDEDSNAQSRMDYRVMHSNLKSNGEYIDSWIKYQPANYIDVDSKYGEITHLRKFNNKLFFWQDQATGLLSVNERTQITDESNLPLILGNGGVLDRYDYIDDTAGMKKELYCDTMSDKALYWYDDHNNEIKRAADGSGLVSLTKAHGVQNIMHTYDDNNKPWMFYDKKYNEVVLDLSDTIKQSIVFNENINAFTSIYDVGFDGAVTFKDGIYLLNTQSGGETAVEIITKKIPKEQDNQNQQELQTQPAPVVPRRNKMTPIDLGLSVKWGDRYLDAPDEYSEGLHTGWGDITGNINGNDYSKYTNGLTNISGNPQYDIATAKLGDGWRLPTREEYLELVRSEDLTWYYNYNAGYFRAEAKNGNSVIFAYTSIKENDGSPVKDSKGAILFNSKNHMYAWLGDVMKSFPDSCAYDMNIHILSPEKTDEKQILRLSYWDTPVGSTVCNKLCVRPVYDGPDIEEDQPIIMPTPIQPQPIEPEYETVQEVKYITSGANLQLGKWNEGDVTNFDGKINTYIEYVVNKNPLVTKVFDNQEIVSSYLPDIEGPDKAWFSENHTYSWKTDLNAAEDVYYLQMTNREGNYRFAIPRANNAAFGNRIRGKYMICSIEDTAPEVDASISYIITKFRTSWS